MPYFYVIYFAVLLGVPDALVVTVPDHFRHRHEQQMLLTHTVHCGTHMPQYMYCYTCSFCIYISSIAGASVCIYCDTVVTAMLLLLSLALCFLQ